MNAVTIAKAYLDALTGGDYKALLQLFASDAVVLSPLYGEQPATAFYQKLLEDTRNSELTFLDVFTNESGRRVSLNFRYRWTMANGLVSEFDCVDIFDIDENGKITRLKIIYDTARTRPAFHQL